MSFKRLLYAPNIHQGGGRSLLLPILLALENEVDIALVLDERMRLPEGFKFTGTIFRVHATLFSRLKFEWQLRKLIVSDSLLLCMGNLPPLFAHAGRQIVFVQNRYLIESLPLADFPLSVRLRIQLERWWLRSRIRYVQQFIVQTRTMKKLLDSALGANATVLPFSALTETDADLSDREVQYDFLYVATGEPHKNHRVLIEAWIKLADKGEFPSLCLTLDVQRFPELCNWIEQAIKCYELKVVMRGECSHEVILGLYRSSRAMIYPSLLESFGLPLIEAVLQGLPILAADADYVSDIINIEACFDAESPQSVADAVSKFSFQKASLKVNLLSADEFLSNTLCRETNL